MPDNVYKFRTVKHGDPEKKLKILPDSLPKAMTVLAFAALTALCGALAFAAVYAARL
jgi:hypothetical protein